MRLTLLCSLLILLGTCVRAQEMIYPAPYLPEYQEVIRKSPIVITGRINSLAEEDATKTQLIAYTSSYSEGGQIQREITVANNGGFQFPLPVNYPASSFLISIGDSFFEGFWVTADLHLELNVVEAPGGEGSKIIVEKLTGKDARLNEGRNEIFRTIDTEPYANFWSTSLMTAINEDIALEERLFKIDSFYQVKLAAEEPTLLRSDSALASYWRNEGETEYLTLLLTAYNVAKLPLPKKLRQRVQQHVPQIVSSTSKEYYRTWYNRFYHSKEKEVFAPGERASESFADRHARMDRDLGKEFGAGNTDLFKLFSNSTDPNDRLAELDHLLPGVNTPWVREQLLAERGKIVDKLEGLRAATTIQVTSAQLGDFARFIDSTTYNAKRYHQDNNQSAAELLAKLRTAFPGKHLYLDLWATWCGPCIGEFPSSHQLHESVTDLPVEFIYLCTKDVKNAAAKWKTRIDQYKLAGTHLLVDKELHDELLALFGSSGYPTYVLLAPDGSMDLDVRRPSGLTRERLEAMLK